MSSEAISQHQQVTYEQPLSERFRTFLRLEMLFRQLNETIDAETMGGVRRSIAVMAEVYSIIERSDIRTDVLKELDRQSQYLQQLEQNPAVDSHLLSAILRQNNRLLQRIQDASGPVGQFFKEHDFLSGVFQRCNIPGGTCNFDLPEYHHWLNRPPADCNADLLLWVQQLETISSSVLLILKVLREIAQPTQHVAEQGIFQHSLDCVGTCHLVQVKVAADTPHFPEISGGKHRIAIRFLSQPDLAQRPAQANQDIPFLLACCAL